MSDEVRLVESNAKSRMEAVKSAEDLEQFRVDFLGKKGKLTALMEKIREIAPEDRREYGQKVNALKSALEQAVQAKGSSLQPSSNVNEESIFDESLPGVTPHIGRIHPISQTVRDICRIFQNLGFETVEGPEIETEFHNFTALNIPLDHASRDSFDTFYTDSGELLRSQTSTVQIRLMQSRKPPLRVIAPGRVYRPDTVDASHSFMFHQIEGLMVDDRTTFSDLKGIIHLFLRELFGQDVKIRFRPHFFPFTEPSVEVDLRWGNKGWLEILGAGSVDPNVFQAVGYNPKEVQGFAFGLGVERIAMLRYGIQDIRYFNENDIRFLRQF